MTQNLDEVGLTTDDLITEIGNLKVDILLKNKQLSQLQNNLEAIEYYKQSLQEKEEKINELDREMRIRDESIKMKDDEINKLKQKLHEFSEFGEDKI